MSLLSKLFGGGAKAAREPETVTHEGFTITAKPSKTDGGFRIGAVIEKDGKRHELIRADIIGDKTAADEASVLKAKQMIDQMGARLFD
ncbi:HlyU family transcriptional regulator [Roseobacteraceae bacterium S113]